MVFQKDTNQGRLPYKFLHHDVFALIDRFQPTF
jgi:hypothetical protein